VLFRKFFHYIPLVCMYTKGDIPDGNVVHGVGSGNVKWKNSRFNDVELRDVMLVLDFNQNLVSVKKMTEKNVTVTFNKTGLKVILHKNAVATEHLDKGSSWALYMLDCKPCVQKNFARVTQVKNRI